MSVTFTDLQDQRVPINWDAITATNVAVMIKLTKNKAFGHLCTLTYQTSRSNILFSKQAELSLWIRQSLDTNTQHV